MEDLVVAKDEYYDLDEKTDPFMEDLVMAKKEPEPEPEPVAVVDTPNPRAAEASPGARPWRHVFSTHTSRQLTTIGQSRQHWFWQ
jgi:hypothetical protein